MVVASTSTPAVRIDARPCGKDIQRFLDVARTVYRDDPQYVAPLDVDLKERLDPKKNPFFQRAEVMTFVAHRDGRDVGRASASIDREHLRIHGDATGFFGFLDTLDDPDVCRALLDAAAQWLRSKGMRRMLGPLSLSIHGEIGCLVDGFDTPPMIRMPHHRPYQGKLIEAAGLAKEKDLFAWRYMVGDVPPRARRAHDEISRLPEVRFRSLDPKRLDAELNSLLEVFNDAWADSWGFVPCSAADLRTAFSDVRRSLLPELALFVEIHGKPAAVAVSLPNLNEVIRDLDGKLSPLGAGKLLWRLKVVGTSSTRLPLLGIRRQYRGVKRYGGLSTALYVETNDRNRRAGIKFGEISWTLEDNAPANAGIRTMGGRVYKTYRVYARGL